MTLRKIEPTLFLLLIILAAFPICSAAQRAPRDKTILRCGTQVYYKQRMQRNPRLMQEIAANQRAAIAKMNQRILGNQREQALSDTITVVVHVVGSQNLQSLVTDAVVHSQIEVLNEDFRGRNADSTRIPPAFKPRFGKSNLVFMLAGTNPVGEPTTGISRTVSNVNFSISNSDDVKTNATGGEDGWDSDKYLNIWVTELTGGLLGISVFPGDPLPVTLHGFVCDYRAFGRIGSHLYANFNRGRTTTHELGHFFNLIHIWGDDEGAPDECSGTDFPGASAVFDDTPNQQVSTSGSPDPAGTGVVVTDDCSPTAPGIMYQNYMDYTDDDNMALFTKGQQQRMEDAVLSSPDRLPLLSSVAYKPAPVYSLNAGIRKITNPSPDRVYCKTDVETQLILRNSGTTTLSSVQIVSVINNNPAVVYNWTGSLAAYTETTITLPQVTGQAGVNELTVYTTNPNNGTDQYNLNDTMEVNFNISSPVALPILENFVSPTFPPGSWSVYNPDHLITWDRADVGFGNIGSAFLNSFQYAVSGEKDELYSPQLNYAPADSLILKFNLSAATYSPPATTTIPIDTLEILVTKDCGNSFTSVYKKWGEDLTTIGSQGTTNDFFPTTASQWKEEYVDLTSVANNESVQVVFRAISNYENNIFIDNVNLYTVTLPPLLKEQGYLIYPNPFSESFQFWFLQTPNGLQSMTIYNSAGAIVWKQQFSLRPPNQINVQLPQLQRGMYFIKMSYNDRKMDFTRPILKH